MPPSLADAARDYRMLLDRGYPVTASIKLVGDRYGLEKPARMVLFRGVLSARRSDRDKSRLLGSMPPGARVAIDGYNVLFTLVNYRAGHPLFIATDGLLRDAGGAHGRIANDGLFAESVAMMAGRVASLGVSEATVFLDSPVPGSAGHAALIREAFGAVSVPVDAALVRCADGPVSSFIGDAAASSDSEIIADSLSPIFDLARDVLESAYAARFLDISSLIV